MSGIIFFGTQQLVDLKDFYTNFLQCRIWMEQSDCVILQHGNLLFGFCQRETVDKNGIITFFYDKKKEVDRMYEKFEPTSPPHLVLNKKYNIYHFFAEDPEGRKLEFQYFENPIDGYHTGDEILTTRRSIRRFKDEEIPDEILTKVLNNCRFAPTSMNTQSYYFKIIRDADTINWLAERRGKSSSPIGRGPVAVAVCSDPDLSRRHIQDGCIAAYHFLLAAWSFGLGTCWIAAMDREDVKQRLNIQQTHYVATVTPLGYPDEYPDIPERKTLSWFIKD